MKYLIYARVSPRGDTETETSIQMQIDLCKEYVKEQGGEVYKVLSDEFYSGKSMNRPAFREIISELEAGKAEWDCFCVYKLSRMSRSLRDGAHIFDLFYRWNKGFVSVTERNLDFSTPTGRAMLGMLQVFNQFEREQTAENTRNKMLSMARKGLWPSGKPPFGYKRGGKGDNKLYIDPRKAEIVKDVFQMYASSSFTTGDILRKHKSISKHMMLDMIANETYLGYLVWGGEKSMGQHEPIIDRALFDAAQEKRPDIAVKSRPKAQKYNYLLTGLLRCHCGRFMTPASAKSGRYHYYVCTDSMNCKNRIKAESIEKSAIDKVKNFSIKEEIIVEALRIIEEKRKSHAVSMLPEISNVKSAMAAAESSKKRIIELIMSSALDKGNIAVFNDKLSETTAEIDRLRSRLEYLKSQSEVDFSVYDRASDIVRAMKQIKNAINSAHGSDPDVIRQALVINIEKIVGLDKNEYMFYFNYGLGSSKGDEWGGIIDINELYRITFFVA